MKCHGCNSSMLLDRQETTGRVTTEWYQCPVCSKMHMHSELAQSRVPFNEWGDGHESSHESNTEKSTVAYSPRQGITYA